MGTGARSAVEADAAGRARRVTNAFIQLASIPDEPAKSIASLMRGPSHSRSAGDKRRCASRARASAADAPYRWSIWRDFQPAIRMRSASVPP
jgi:hypothetical protein